MDTMELYESPVRDRNEDKYGHSAGLQCICCMKPIKDESKCLWVQMSTDWEVVHPSVDESEFDSQGAFPVGLDCAKKMSGFTFKM